MLAAGFANKARHVGLSLQAEGNGFYRVDVSDGSLRLSVSLTQRKSDEILKMIQSQASRARHVGSICYLQSSAN